MIDTTFDFRSDTPPGLDPDTYSPTLRRYHRLLWSKPLPSGVPSGERMDKARHTAGQRVLDRTGNLKAVQKFLGHASIQTTADIYTDWDIDQLAETLLEVLD
jgi:integrase